MAYSPTAALRTALSREGVNSYIDPHNFIKRNGISHSLPSDNIEYVNSDGGGIDTLLEMLEKRGKVFPSLRGYETSGLIIFVGGAYLGMTERTFSKRLKRVNLTAEKLQRNVIILAGPGDEFLQRYARLRTMHVNTGYQDWGIQYMKDYPRIAMVFDIAGMWSKDKEHALLLVPHSPTIAGLHVARKFMRKADTMVSHYLPYEMIEPDEHRYGQEVVRCGKMVSQLVKTWDPSLTICSENVTSGSIWADGDRRIYMFGRQKHPRPLVWSVDDVGKPPISDNKGHTQDKSKYTLQDAYYADPRGECRICGETFVRSGPLNSICSDECREVLLRDRAWWPNLDREEVLKYYREGHTIQETAEEFNTGNTAVWLMIHNRAYSNNGSRKYQKWGDPWKDSLVIKKLQGE